MGGPCHAALFWLFIFDVYSVQRSKCTFQISFKDIVARVKLFNCDTVSIALK